LQLPVGEYGIILRKVSFSRATIEFHLAEDWNFLVERLGLKLADTITFRLEISILFAQETFASSGRRITFFLVKNQLLSGVLRSIWQELGTFYSEH